MNGIDPPQPTLFPVDVAPVASAGQRPGREEQVRRAYDFLQGSRSSGFTKQELATATGWTLSTVGTYLTKKWRGYVHREKRRYWFRGIERLSWEQFRELHSQVDPAARGAEWYGSTQERADLDFVGPLDWNAADTKTRYGILKTVLGMSNCPSGGRIVVGVIERQGQFDFVGVTEEQAASFEQTRVVDFLRANSDGHIDVRIETPSVHGKRFVVLVVSPYDDIPVLSRANEHGLRRGAPYIRTEAAQTKIVESTVELRLVLRRMLEIRSTSRESR